MQEYVNTQYMKEHATTLKDYAKHKNAAMLMLFSTMAQCHDRHEQR